MTQQWLDIQTILRAKGYALGFGGPNGDGVDGSPGNLTAAAILAELLKANPDALARVSGLRDSAAFFANLRTSGLFVKGLMQEQVDGLNTIVAACGEARWPIAWTAYGLATAYHETAHTMQPIKEHGGPSYFHRMYDLAGERPHVAKRLGNTEAGDGARYAGRGYVQLTGRANYRKAGNELQVGLEANPDLAMKADIGAKILIKGMSSGWFTGKKLADTLPTNKPATFEQFKASRPIINGRDRDSDIGNYALRFQAALNAGGWA